MIGLGGLGCPIAQYLVTSGLGNITLIDDDYVESTNLQRQILHKENNIGEKKIDSAKKTLLAYNKDLNLITFDATLNSDNAINISVINYVKRFRSHTFAISSNLK